MCSTWSEWEVLPKPRSARSLISPRDTLQLSNSPTVQLIVEIEIRTNKQNLHFYTFPHTLCKCSSKLKFKSSRSWSLPHSLYFFKDLKQSEEPYKYELNIYFKVHTNMWRWNVWRCIPNFTTCWGRGCVYEQGLDEQWSKGTILKYNHKVIRNWV